MNSNNLKNYATELGARLCGIGSVDRFSNAPKGFSPLDLFPQTQSVIAFAKQITKGSLYLSTTIPYSVSELIMTHETHRIALELCLYIENHGYLAVIVPSEPYEYWDEENQTGKGLVSLKHIAYNSGLGTWGKNHLLYNPEIGSLIKIGAVLTNAKLEPDPLMEESLCKPGCQKCIDSCSSGALSEMGVNQLKCREFSQGKTLKGETIYTCNMCRKVCPNVSGSRSGKYVSTL
ncbi:MAG: epoxyqueuosine reductase [Bacteroidota bacterium]|nr:epoxyqueuosine reductase [Bacteroidota bacterium]